MLNVTAYATTNSTNETLTYKNLAGDTRYDTSILTSKEAYPNGAKNVILVKGTSNTDGILAEVTIQQGTDERVVNANGNGRLSAVSNAIKQYFGISYELTIYEEHSLSKGSSSKAVTYVGVSYNGKLHWGVGIHEDIIVASIHALVAAVNQLDEVRNVSACKDQRLLEIMNYIQMNYLTVTLDELSEKFFLSKPYLSKYIKEKSGITFGEAVKKVRMRKARTLLKNRNMTVESIAESVGYQNVEHFNRLFKKAYGMTPIQFRNQK